MTSVTNPTEHTVNAAYWRRYVVIGAGAVGATIAAELHRAGVDTLLVARGVHADVLRENGLTYVRPDGSHQLHLPVVSSPAEVDLTDGDVLVLATKSQHAEAAVREWAWRPVKRADGTTGLAATDLPLVTLQNGLDSERIALRSFARVLGAVVWIPAQFVVPGEVVNHAAPVPAVLWLGPYPSGDGTVAQSIAADLRRGGFTAHTVDDIAGHKAVKLIGNLVNSLDALYPPSELRDIALGRLREEATAVYRAAGITPVSLPSQDFRAADIPGHARVGNSTWQSLARGGTTEIDFLNGEIVLLGRLHGVSAPYNAAIQARIHRAVTEGVGPGTLDDADLAATLPGLTTAAPIARPVRRASSGSSSVEVADAAAVVPGSIAAAPDPASDVNRGDVDSTGNPVLISVDALHRRVADADPPVLLDVRWALGDPHGEQHYRDGHLPGAVFVDLETELAAPASPSGGRHPLPTIDRLQAAARRWGITGSVVVYDNTGGLAAARAWWLLRWAGVPEVLILDGGLAAWRAAGHAVVSGEARLRAPSEIVLRGGRLPTLTADQAAALPQSGTLVDARAAERYRGDVEPVDPRAGHIPGAISLPTTGNLRAGSSLFRTAEELRERFAGLRGPVGVYCGSGVTAAHEIAALAVAGIDAALYPGSWSAWSADPARPVATGEEAGRPQATGEQPAPGVGDTGETVAHGGRPT